MMRRYRFFILLGILTGCDAEEPAAPKAASPGHTKMVEVLRQIAQRSVREHPYLGSAQIEQLEQALATLPADAPQVRRSQLEFFLGGSLARHGQVRSAIECFEKSLQLLPETGIDPAIEGFVKFRLGVAWLRLGETENCCAQNAPESCILPIRGAGVHTNPRGSTNAIRYFEQVLAGKSATPQTVARVSSNSAGSVDTKLAARWLLNLAYMTLGGYPDRVPKQYLVPEKAFRSSVEFPRFHNVAKSLGLSTFNLCGSVIVDDFDGDGNLDVVTSTWDVAGQMRYFRNEGNGKFADRTEASGLEGLTGGLNLIQADYDNDGHLDYYVLRGAWLGVAGQHPNSLIHNNGDGTFTDVTFEAGLGDVHYPTQTGGWADYDNDGDVDLFVGNEHGPGMRAPCQLFRNEGNGTFVDVAAQAGVQNFGFAKGCTWGDFDGDGWQDLYVSNYPGDNRLYRNGGDGTFADVASKLGVTKPHASFPTWFWDFDNDGALDLFVSSYTGRVDTLAAYHLGEKAEFEIAGLYRNDGRGGFKNVAEERGLAYPMLPMGSNFGDINGDGFPDFYLGTGDPEYHSLVPNVMFLNLRGERFADVTMAGGFGHLQKGHGIAFADLDNDGDLDVFAQMGGAFAGDRYGDALFENPGFGTKWITVQLVGTDSNRSAIGARIRVDVNEGGKTRSIYRWVNSGGSFGANPLRQTIGLGQASRIEALRVRWPATGKEQRFESLDPNCAIRLIEGDGEVHAVSLQKFSLGG